MRSLFQEFVLTNIICIEKVFEYFNRNFAFAMFLLPRFYSIIFMIIIQFSIYLDWVCRYHSLYWAVNATAYYLSPMELCSPVIIYNGMSLPGYGSGSLLASYSGG